jgi:hypothetical protein
VRSLWDRIRLRAEERYKPLRGMLSRATVEAVEGNTLTIGVVDTLTEGFLRERAGVLEEAVADAVRVPMRVRFKTGSAGRGRSSAHRGAPEASAESAGGEVDPLLAYARKKLGTMETT